MIGEARQRRDVLVDDEDRLAGRFKRCQNIPDLAADDRGQPERVLEYGCC